MFVGYPFSLGGMDQILGMAMMKKPASTRWRAKRVSHREDVDVDADDERDAEGYSVDLRFI